MPMVLTTLLSLAALLQAGAWQATSPLVRIETGDAAITVRNTGPGSADLWRPGVAPVATPYTVSATFRKLSGRRHEGYGILFGGRALGTDSARYAYVLVRGDGALLIKQRTGAETPVVRDWAPAAAIRADDARNRAENRLEVRVGTQEVTVIVNGAVVASVPAAGLHTEGVAGLRLSHTLGLEVQGFGVAPTR